MPVSLLQSSVVNPAAILPISFAHIPVSWAASPAATMATGGLAGWALCSTMRPM